MFSDVLKNIDEKAEDYLIKVKGNTKVKTNAENI